MSKDRLSVTIATRVDPELDASIRAAAEKDRRSLAQFMRVKLADAVAALGNQRQPDEAA